MSIEVVAPLPRLRPLGAQGAFELAQDGLRSFLRFALYCFGSKARKSPQGARAVISLESGVEARGERPRREAEHPRLVEGPARPAAARRCVRRFIVGGRAGKWFVGHGFLQAARMMSDLLPANKYFSLA